LKKKAHGVFIAGREIVPCWNATVTGDKDVLDVVLMKRSFICIIKHNIRYDIYVAYIRREEPFVCYLLMCHEHKNADKSFSSNSKKSNVFVLVKKSSETAWAVGRDT